MEKRLLEFFGGDELAANVWFSKYRFEDEVLPTDMFNRHVKEIAEKELQRIFCDNFEQIFKQKRHLLTEHGRNRYEKVLTSNLVEHFRKYISFDNITLGGSMMQGIGNHNIFSSLSNCFVLGQPYDSYGGINKKGDEIVQVMKRRGGAGLDLSTIRPKGTKVNNQARYSSGPVLFAEGYSHKTKEVAQDGRRGALMLSLMMRHPDALDFILAKQDLEKITGANISVGIDDDFMRAVENDDDYLMCFPVDADIKPLVQNKEFLTGLSYNELIQFDESGFPQYENAPKSIKKIRAKEYWDILVRCAWKTAEPGILFIGNWKKYGYDWDYEQFRPVTTNPCFAANTPVLTKNGYYNIVDLVGQNVEIWNGERWSNVEPKVTGENQEMLRVTLSNGSIIECTKYHNWPLWSGFSHDGKEYEIEARHLEIGDKISKFNLPIVEFGETLDERFAYSRGFYCGDGTSSRNSARLYGEKIKLLPYLLGEQSATDIRQNHYGTDYINFIFSDKLFEKSFVPKNYSIKTRLDWLSGYIDADGTIDEAGGCQISNTNFEVIDNVRLMLETLGIQANINNCHKEGIKSLPDQKGGRVDVHCKATNRILIRSLDVQKLLKLGLKTYRCDFTKYEPKRDTAGFITVKKIEKIPNADKVYCFTEPYRHRGTFNGIVLGQCSEIPMQPYDACRLLATNMYTFVKKPFTKDAHLDYDHIYDIFYEQLIIGDLLIDLELDYIGRIIDKIKSCDDPEELKNPEILLWERIATTAKSGRRCGAGFTGLGDMLAALNLPYNSPEVIDRVFHIKFKAELDAVTDLSILFGTFEGFSADAYVPEVLAIEFPEEYERMCEYGRRMVSWSTGAPTGSTSLCTQTTSGIEPIFMPFYKRRKKCVLPTDRVDYIDPADKQKFSEYLVLHPKFELWINLKYGFDKKTIEAMPIDEMNLLFEQSPWFNSCAKDLGWKERVNIQAIVQKYTTHAISSTINLPKDCKPDLIGNIYMESWKRGLKGNTVYRDGSRGGILVSANDGNKEPVFAKRPRVIPGKYHTFKCNRKQYSIILGFINNKPYEIFIVSGLDNLPEVFYENESITGEVVKDTKDWYNFVTDTFLVREITDMENEEKLISLMISAMMSNNTPMVRIIKILNKTKPIAGTFTYKLIKILSQYIPDGEEAPNGEKCPACGKKLVFENGCLTCKQGCGWSKC